MTRSLTVSVADISLASHSKEEGWQSLDLLSFNNNKARFRTMKAVEARWHKHHHSDELFLVLSGQLEIDLRAPDKSIATHVLGPHQMLVVHAGCEHRARSEGLTTLLVFDAID